MAATTSRTRATRAPLAKTIRHMLAAAAGAAALLGGLGTADAQRRYDRSYDQGYGWVVAESRWGHGTVRGPVRPGPRGWQVRTPGGSWIDCVRNNCSETLRLETVDLFERMEQKDGGPGYFRWHWRF